MSYSYRGRRVLPGSRSSWKHDDLTRAARLVRFSATPTTFRLHLDLAALSIVEFYPDGHASVRLVNDTSQI